MSDDDLSKRVDRILRQEEARKEAGKQADSDNIAKRSWQKAYDNYQFVKNASKVTKRAYDTGNVILKHPVVTVGTLGISWVAQKYYQVCKWAFLKASYKQETDTYDKVKGASAAVGIALFTWYGVPFTAKAVTEATLIETFAYRDTLLFSKADLINDEQNIWGVSSCTGYPCEGEINTTEHRMRDSMWLDIKYLFTGRVSHDPGELKGAFNSEQNACNVLQYGYRWKIPFGLYFEPFGFKIVPKNGFYPNIIEASCDSVDSDNWQQILNKKRSERPDLKPKQL